MARPIKRGLDYFPLGVNLHGKIEYIQSMYGMLGVMVIISLWQRIYENSYYIEYGKRSAVTFSKDFTQLSRVDDGKRHHWEIFDEIVMQAVEDDLFSKEIFEKYGVLTSREIQETYLKAKEKSAKVEFDERYLLLSDGNFSVFSPKTGVSSPKTMGYLPENATKESKEKKSKVKKSKVKKSKAEESRAEESINAAPAAACFSEYEKYIGLVTPAVAEGIDYYIGQGMTSELINRLIQYSAEQNKRSWQYINAVILGNLTEGIKTLDEYNRHRTARLESSKPKAAKPKGINNYTDVNKPDYSGFTEKILNDLLEEDEEAEE